jgi:hypothetical protein
MSDREIFYIGVFTSILLALHVGITIYQFWKMGKKPDKRMKGTREKGS